MSTNVSPTPEVTTGASPDGPAWAALVSAGIGGLGFGILTDLSEIFPDRAKHLLQFYPPAGSLTGVAVCAIVIWAAAWFGLHVRWNGKQIKHKRTLMAVTLLLVLAALVLTFPPFYDMFA